MEKGRAYLRLYGIKPDTALLEMLIELMVTETKPVDGQQTRTGNAVARPPEGIR